MNISRRKVVVNNPSFMAEEVANSVNNRTDGMDTVNSSKGLTRYY